MPGLARALSKLGHCSRSRAVTLVRDGHVKLNGRVRRDPETPVRLGSDTIEIEGAAVQAAARTYVMLNKPRGLVTTASDELGRDTVYSCFQDPATNHLPAVGRLDKASEGLLLFTNDNAWANAITDPAMHLDKTYHVQIATLADDALLARLTQGITDKDERLTVKRAAILRHGEKNSWLEIVLDEGRNRHIRRLLEAFDIEVLRLIRIAIGPLQLGSLAKGCWRVLTETEIRALRPHRQARQAAQ